MNSRKRVLLVCMGNICRSPTAEGVLRRQVEDRGLAAVIDVDSAGTHGYHVGEAPDARAIAAAARRGYDLRKLRARKLRREDFAAFDLVLAMDRDNLANLLDICPPEYRHRVSLFLAYARRAPTDEVPDPYYGPEAGFDLVLDLVEDAALGLIETLSRG